MSYTLTTTPRQQRDSYRPEVLLAFAPEATLTDIQRGAALAKSLGGRWARGPLGFYLQPSASRKWASLFEAGFSAHRTQLRGNSIWLYRRGNERLMLAEAVRVARREVMPI